MTIKTILASSIEQLWHQLDGVLCEDIQATLAIIMSSSGFDVFQISEVFKKFDIDMIGCTTAGEIKDGSLSEHSITVMLFDIPKSWYKVISESNTDSIKNTARSIRQQAHQAFDSPSLFVLTGGLFNDGEEIVEGLKEGYSEEIKIFGGLAGDDLNSKETFCFTQEVVYNNGIVAIAFDSEHLEINGLATSGWETLGSDHVVTKAKGNIIYSINNEPALDYFIKFFGYYDENRVSGKLVSTISAQYPFQIKKPGGYTVLRSPLASNADDRSLILLGRIEEGTSFRFSISPGVEVIHETTQQFFDFKEASAQEVDALILVSCKGRHAALGPFIVDEINNIYSHWNKPMIGFLSYGEIGNLHNGICDFHNETCCLITFKEK
jgi:hypothetical protein